MPPLVESNMFDCRYALDVNVEMAEDVLLHKRLLHMAKNPATRPAIEVRLGQVTHFNPKVNCLEGHQADASS